ncbi:MAG: lytic transglycosylase domain-containing protein [Clostridia bacterium]|nr:lytic transglycosylase domain-containing protein [Clostridia bacterium]
MRFLYRAVKRFTLILLIVLSLFFLSDCAVKKFFYPLKYKDEIIGYADYYGFDRALIFSLVKTESGFNEKAVSGKGAKGLMQLTDSTAEYVALKKGETEYDIFRPETNLDFGCFYLRYLFLEFADIETALCAYNAGEGRVREWLNDEEYSKDGTSLDKIPFEETENYLKKIRESLFKYKKLYGKLLDKPENFE